MNVQKQRARGIGRVGGVDLAAGKAPQQIAVDGAECEFAPRRAFTGFGNMVEEPRELGS